MLNVQKHLDNFVKVKNIFCYNSLFKDFDILKIRNTYEHRQRSKYAVNWCKYFFLMFDFSIVKVS